VIFRLQLSCQRYVDTLAMYGNTTGQSLPAADGGIAVQRHDGVVRSVSPCMHTRVRTAYACFISVCGASLRPAAVYVGVCVTSLVYKPLSRVRELLTGRSTRARLGVQERCLASSFTRARPRQVRAVITFTSNATNIARLHARFTLIFRHSHAC